MPPKILTAAVAIGLAAGLTPLAPAEAHGLKERRTERDVVIRDCTPFNGPSNYYGNPWCDGGWKYDEDFAPGTGRAYDVFDLPQLRHLDRRRDW